MSRADFDDSASACAIDALSIICKRSTNSSAAFLGVENEEVENVHAIIKSGEASRSDLEDASSSNILWSSIVLLLKNSSYFAGTGDISTMASDLPVHVQRFFGALFSTFEVLMDHQRSNSAFLVGSLITVLGLNVSNIQETVMYLIREYKSLFSYSYMFNRRTGVHPVSQVQQVLSYFDRAGAQPSNTADSDAIMNLDDDDDDNDSYERLMRANIGNFNAPKFGAPSVMPLRPVKHLSDDEHYGSDYQPAIASDLETDLTYNNSHRSHDDSHGALQDDSIFSMDGGSILNSYYKYNGWNNVVEEDEDSDNDHYVPPVMEPARPKRMTRMRQATSRSFDNNDGEETKTKSTRKKKAKKGTKKTAKPLTTDRKAGPGEVKPSLPWASMASKGILSDDSDESNDDEESDYSESDHLPVQRAAHTNMVSVETHRFASRQIVPPLQNDEVEDFEMEDDTYAPTITRNPVSSHSVPTSRNTSHTSTSSHDSAGYAGRREPETHSPNSGNSSIELSDRERLKDSPPARYNSTAQDWRLGNNQHKPRDTTQLQSQRAETARPTGGRMRSVLSDDDESETEEMVSSKQQAGNALSGRNPLDQSIETLSPGVFNNKSSTSARTRNPLDESIEFPSSRASNMNSSTDWARGSNAGLAVGPSIPADVAPAQTTRSVVRLPSTSPSRPAASKSLASGHGKVGSTEGPGVDLVEDWDSQLSDEDTAALATTTRKDAQANNVSRQQSSLAPGVANLRSALAVTAPPTLAPESNRSNPASRFEEETNSSRKSSPSNVSQERTAEMERLRQNILRSKREKEIAGSVHSGNQTEFRSPPLEQSRPQGVSVHAKRDPSPSVLRKSVTFEDQQSGAPKSTAQTAIARAEHREQRVAAPEEDASLVAPLQHRSVTGSAADMVLYASRQESSWNDQGSGEREMVDSEESFLQSPLDSPYDDLEHSPTVGVAAMGIGAPEVTPQQFPPRQEQNSPKLPPSRSSLGSISGHVAGSGSVSVHPGPAVNTSQGQSAAGLVLTAPTLSRISSDQFMPPRSQTESPREHSRDSRIATSRQFSSSKLSVSSSISRPLLTLPGNFIPPPLSEFALNSGIIMEGYLHKKSGMLGIWQKRYFVLSESTTSFCVLRIFARAVTAAWGPAAVGLKASIPIHSIEAVESVPTPAAKGKEFTIKFYPRVSKQSLSAGVERDSDVNSDAGSEFSDSMFATGGTKLTTLLAEDAQTRLLWVTMLTRVLAIAVEEI